MPASWNMSTMPMLGEPVLDNTGEQLGTVKDVRGRFFKVDVAMAPDYWLDQEAIADYASGRVVLAMSKDQVGDHTVDEPASDEESDHHREERRESTLTPNGGAAVERTPVTTSSSTDQRPGRLRDDQELPTGSMSGRHETTVDDGDHRGAAGVSSVSSQSATTLDDPLRGGPAGTTERREWTTPTTGDLATHRAGENLVTDRARRSDDDPRADSTFADGAERGERS